MSLKAELETWASALKAYESNDFATAIQHFEKIADTSKICWNIGIILATLGRHEEAVERFGLATSMDGYFTVAYQQKGVSNFMMGRYEAAHQDFENALLYLRGNQTINYEQLGLDFRLYSAEVLFNCGLTKIYLGQIAAGMADLREAQKQKQAGEHAVIDDAIRDEGRDYNVFSVPVGILFRPSPIKLKNLAAKDYMGKAVLVAASDVNDAYTTFTGITRLRRGQTPTGAPLEAGYPLGRSASVSAIPEPVDKTPIATRLSRSNTVTMARSAPSSPPRVTGGSSGNDNLSPYRNGNDAPLSRNLTTVRPSRPTLAPLDTDLPSSSLGPPFNPRSGARSNTTPPLSINKLKPITPPRSNALEVTLEPLEHDGGRESPLLRTPPSLANTAQAGQARIDTLRITELYDDYYKEALPYDDDELRALPPIGARKKELEAWTKKTPLGSMPGGAMSGGQLGRSASFARGPPSSFAGAVGGVYSGGGGGRGLMRAPSRAGSAMGGSRESRYEDEGSEGGYYDMVKIRVKVHAGNLTRGMSVFPTQSFSDFTSSLRSKFPHLVTAGAVNVRFKDEDGDMLSMQDEGDFEAAVDVARVLAGGRPEGKLEIWVD